VGATFTGVEVAEWLAAATIAVAGEIPVERLWDAIPAFPTRGEIWLELLEQRRRALAARRSTAPGPRRLPRAARAARGGT
jgi:hypothetical protein